MCKLCKVDQKVCKVFKVDENNTSFASGRRPSHPCAERPKLARRSRERPKLPKLWLPGKNCGCPEKNRACYAVVDEAI